MVQLAFHHNGKACRTAFLDRCLVWRKREAAHQSMSLGSSTSGASSGSNKTSQRMASEASLLPANFNSTSKFLTLLPIEIRLLIYGYVFSGHKSFLFIRANYVTAPKEHSDDRNLRIRSHEWTSYPFATHPGLSLLRACRQIYTEGLDVALSSHIFYLRGPAHFDNLKNRRLRPFRPRRLSRMRHFEVQWFYCSGPEYKAGHQHAVAETDTWDQIWTVIATEMRLSSMELRLEYAGPMDQMHVDAAWLKPLRRVRGVKSVKIDIRHFENHFLIEAALNKALCDIMSSKVHAEPMLPCSLKSLDTRRESS